MKGRDESKSLRTQNAQWKERWEMGGRKELAATYQKAGKRSSEGSCWMTPTYAD